jgi:hypothetical protein
MPKLKPSTFAPFSELMRSSLASVFAGLQAKSKLSESNAVDEQKINFDRCMEIILGLRDYVGWFGLEDHW